MKLEKKLKGMGIAAALALSGCASQNMQSLGAYGTSADMANARIYNTGTMVKRIKEGAFDDD